MRYARLSSHGGNNIAYSRATARLHRLKIDTTGQEAPPANREHRVPTALSRHSLPNFFANATITATMSLRVHSRRLARQGTCSIEVLFIGALSGCWS